MKSLLTPITFAAAVLTGAQAQAQEWKYTASFYLFTAETKTGVGDRSATLSFSDALENLDMAFMGAFEAHNGQWGVLVDYMLTDIGFDQSTPGTNFGDLEASVKTQILTGYVSYRLYDTGSVKTDVLAGARWFDTDTTLRLTAGTSPENSRRTSDDWIDPVIGARSIIQINDKWTATALFDYGGMSDRDTWQVLLAANYAINDSWSASIGYRHIDVNNDEDGRDYSFEQTGPMIGVSYRF